MNDVQTPSRRGWTAGAIVLVLLIVLIGPMACSVDTRATRAARLLSTGTAVLAPSSTAVLMQPPIALLADTVLISATPSPSATPAKAGTRAKASTISRAGAPDALLATETPDFSGPLLAPEAPPDDTLPPPAAPARATATAAPSAAAPAASPTPAGTATPANTPTPVPTHTPGPSPTPTPVGTVSAQIIPPDQLPELHLWLGRPFSAEFRQWGAQNFPYASRGDGNYVLHTGMDIGNPMDTPILAVGDGIITYAGTDATEVYGPFPNYYGQLIVLQLRQQYGDLALYALYGHVNQISVKPGQVVQAGDQIGTVGMTGIALGPHLHFEVRVGEPTYFATRNPEFWLRPLAGGYGVLAGRFLGEEGAPIAKQPLLVYRQAQLDKVWLVLETYLQEPEINPDDQWQENFLLADVPAGDYLLVAKRFGAIVRQPFTIEPDGATFVELRWQVAGDG